MKNSKFWVWFIPLFIVVSIGICIMLIRNNKVETNNNDVTINQDAVNIKNSYIQNDDINYKVNISDNNVYRYIDENALLDLIEKNDGLIFVGDVTSNISRKALEVLNEVVSSTSVEYVNYIDVNRVSKAIENKLNKKEIFGGTLISVQGGNVLKVFYPDDVLDNLELTNEEKEKLYNSYKEIVSKFIEECDEHC